MTASRKWWQLPLLACVAIAAEAAAARVEGILMPRVAPGGEWIAVSYQGAIAKVSRTGGPLILLSRGEGWDGNPAWSPDGRRIAYVNAPSSGGRHMVHFGGELRLLDAANGVAIALLKPVHAVAPLWFHPDGRRLLGRFGPRNATPLAWLDLATGAVAPIDLGEHGRTMAQELLAPFALSDDGEWIFFPVHPERPGEQAGDSGSHAQLFRVRAGGGTPERIGRFPARVYGLSADGAGRGLFVVTDAGVAHNDIWHVPLPVAASASEWVQGARKLTFSQADDDFPSANARGQWLIHTDNSAGATRLVWHDLASGRAETVRIDRVEHGGPTARVRLIVRDHDGSPAVARFSVKRRGGRFHAPVAAQYRIAAGLGHFYARGEAELELPAGEYELKAFRGPEYRMFAREFTVTAGVAQDVSLQLERWIDSAARGWFSGENHIHANYGYGVWYNSPRTILDQCEGEDLRVGNIVVANSDGEAVFDREFFLGRPDPVSTPRHIIYWNEEFRSTLWGHLTLFNLTRLIEPLFTGFRDTTNPWDVPTNTDIAARVRADGGVTSYTHPTRNHDVFLHAYSAKGLPVDVALGQIDMLDLMGGAYETSIPVWYHLLNCGYKMPAAAGTDCFLNRLPASLPGYGRVYVHLPDGFDYPRWTAALKAGRSFVSNGPWIELTVNGRPVGDTLPLDRPAKVRIRGRAESQFRLREIEVIYNGRVAARGAVASDGFSATIDEEIEVDRSGWIALKTSGPALPYWQGGDRGAHTSPIYVDVRGRPLERAASARYFLAWIDRLEQMVRERDRMHTGRAHVEAQFEAAREVYRRMLWEAAGDAR